MKAIADVTFAIIGKPWLLVLGCGIGIVALATVWDIWSRHQECIARRSVEFDRCLILHSASEVLCGALIRLGAPERGC